jgi:HlyD family secretion protein
MSVRQRIATITVIAIIAGAGVYAWSQRAEHGAGTELVLYGNVDIREVDLAFNGSERIADLKVNEGAQVHAGDVLGSLQTERLQAAVDQAQAQVEAQQQVVARLVAGTRSEEIRKARADAAAAEAQRKNAAVRLQRVQGLIKRSLASQEQLDDAQAAADVAAAQAKAAQAGLELALAGARDEDIAQARASLQALQAALALAQRNLADAQLQAPADGVIRNRILEPGDMASPLKPVYTLALTDPLWVRAYVDEPDLGRLHPGLHAQVQTDSFPGKTYDGWIGYISPTAEFTPKSVETVELRSDLVYQVRVFVCNPQNELRLGMPATVTITPDAATDDSPGCAGG